MTEKQVTRYKDYLKKMIYLKTEAMDCTEDPEMKEFIHGKLEAYQYALTAFDIICETTEET